MSEYVTDATGRLDLTDEKALGAFIGKSLASFVSGNRMPEISGDNRKRIPPHIRDRYDSACEQAATEALHYIRAALLPTEPPAQGEG